MKKTDIFCSGCRGILPAGMFNLGSFAACPSCSAPLRVEVFPALFRQNDVKAAETLVEGESSCFYHPQKRAVVPCDGCGRFLCSLCELDFNGQHLCPSCLESGKKKEKLETLTNERVRYDRVALGTALLPALCLWPSIIGAPIALYIAIRYRNRPTSVTNPTKVWYTIAAVMASLEILGWITLLIFFITKS